MLLIDEPSGIDYYCNTDASSCNITVTGNCNADMCLNSTYHCPSGNNCASCMISCEDTKICKFATIYSYSCDYVKILADNQNPNILEGIEPFYL